MCDISNIFMSFIIIIFINRLPRIMNMNIVFFNLIDFITISTVLKTENIAKTYPIAKKNYLLIKY